jgi:hypothetical protein
MKSNKNSYSAKEIVKFFHPEINSPSAFRKWTKMPDFPQHAKTKDVRRGAEWDLKIVFEWWRSHYMGDTDLSKKMLREKFGYQKARTLREKLSAEEMQRNLISLDKLERDLMFLFSRLKTVLTSWEKRLPPLLEGKDQKTMLRIIHTETVSFLNNFVKGVRLLCKKTEG